ncbi:hypothetical protein [Promicromonospora soli]|uniref:Lipoprotein n=1 Tax=Promicromonospora soli TaxID=2035533 RepID=A0A919KQG4_9MICO|nr:hypothetical protein [Promicromonospora soli]GHH69325.1 hypothetical protein GCM10017772_14110 [Promicromonospora soli]
MQLQQMAWALGTTAAALLVGAGCAAVARRAARPAGTPADADSDSDATEPVSR